MLTLADLAADGCGLPFAEAVPHLAEAVRSRGIAVVLAPPGTGKTTLAPAVVAGGVEGRVVVTQPRRVAVRAAARRLAALTGTEVGDVVGFTVRGERAVRRTTKIEIVTPGVLLRRLLADPALDGVAAVILDEVHERGLETDLLVGLLAEVRELRDDLVVVAMSATLDAAGLSELLGGADGPSPVVGCAAASYDLDVKWAPASGPVFDVRGVSRSFLDHVAEVTVRAFAARPDDGDVLVFVPGAWEVSQVATTVRSRTGADVMELHGRAAASDQDRAIAGRSSGDIPRIIVSTSIAESSLTVNGVRVVVDAGLAREPCRDAVRGMSGLVTVTCSRSSANQRAGRAARQGPGVVWRCYDEATYSAMRAQAAPEVASSDLTGALLTLACWGTPRGEGLALPTELPAASVSDGERVLRSLGAVDDEGRVTSSGRQLATIPAEPRWARALIDGARRVGRRTAAEVVAAVTLDCCGSESDLDNVLSLLRNGSSPHSARWRSEVRRLERLVADPSTAGDRVAGVVVGLAFPDRVARRMGASYLFVSGTRAALGRGGPGAEWLAVADVTRAKGNVAGGTGAVIRLAAALDRDNAREAAAHYYLDEVRAEISDGRVTARAVRALGAIELSSTPVPAAEVGAQTVIDAVRRGGSSLIGWSRAADALRRRLAFVRFHIGDPWPNVSDQVLFERVEEWLAPELAEAASTGRVGAIDLEKPLRRLLPWPEAAEFDRLAPEHLTAPSGVRARLDYPSYDDDGPVVCAVKLQDCFGLTESPTICGARVQFHLLSPARRPLALTDDFASFWAGPYSQVRAEMRGRYPKHAWPETPM